MVINPSGIPKDPHSVFLEFPHGMNMDDHKPFHQQKNPGDVMDMFKIFTKSRIWLNKPCSNHWKSKEFYLLQDCTSHSMIICTWHSPRIGDASPGFRLVLPLRRGSCGRGQRLPAQGGGQWHLRGGEGAPSDPHLWGSHCDEHHVTLAIRCEIHGKYTWNPKTWR